MTWYVAILPPPLDERLAGPQVAGIALCLSGPLLILMKGEPARRLAVEFTRGDLWIAASALSWSIYAVLLKRGRAPSMRPND